MTPIRIQTAEAARRLGVSQKTVIRFIGAGEIAGARVGRRWTIELAAVTAYLEWQASTGSAACQPPQIRISIAGLTSDGPGSISTAASIGGRYEQTTRPRRSGG